MRVRKNVVVNYVIDVPEDESEDILKDDILQELYCCTYQPVNDSIQIEIRENEILERAEEIE